MPDRAQVVSWLRGLGKKRSIVLGAAQKNRNRNPASIFPVMPLHPRLRGITGEMDAGGTGSNNLG